MKELFMLYNQGIMDFYFVDEAGFSLTPNISYAWQPIGVEWGIKSVKKKIENVLGFLNPLRQHLVTYKLPKGAYMNSELFIQYMNDFASKITKQTAVIVDRASWHTSALTLNMIGEWEKQGLFVIFLPAYCPHLNLIETLWRKIKYEWFSIKDYHSEATFKRKLKSIFQQYGKDYNIKFSMNIFKSE